MESALLANIAGLERGVDTAGETTDVDALWRIFDAQVTSRHLDAVARELQQRGTGFYTIGSAGHESNAAVADALRPTDPALLHYRSGGFYAARAAQVEGSTPVRDVVLSLMGAADEPISGGRHKVFGNAELSIIPQTSTIASHLPRAVGLAMWLPRTSRLGVASEWPKDAVVVCSFGDASANHSTATGAINAALNTAHRGLPVPVLFVCEDNGRGISVPTPTGWIESAYGSRPGLEYVQADGTNPLAVRTAAESLAETVRRRRVPGFLHLSCVRFLGHAGSDAEISYRTPREVAADYALDPILGTARTLVRIGAATTDDVAQRYAEARHRIDDVVAEAAGSPTLSSSAQIVAPLTSHTPDAVAEVASRLRSPVAPGTTVPAATMAESINATLAAAIEHEPRVVVFGEDVGRKGGVYGLTRGLQRRFGAGRVFDTILDEQSILGLALGGGLTGLIPVPEIQYLAYLHNAEDQLRGEAASLSFFSQARYRNPMVVRIAGLAYQRGFGGHFHNDNGVAVLRDIPGLVVACPARGDDAAAMLRTCLAAGAVDGQVSVFLEPIALYHTRDLHDDGDDGWLSTDTGNHVPIGHGRTYGDGTDLTIVTFGNGVRMSLRVARRLAERGVDIRVLDLRWLAPLPVDDLLREARATGQVLVVDETRHSGGVGEAVVSALVEHGFAGRIARVAGDDTFIPLGTAAQHVLVGEDDIEKAAARLSDHHLEET